MQLKSPILSLLAQMQQVLERLTDQQYTAPVGVLSEATVGHHVRHVIEFFLELNNGYKNGLVNYDRRKRDHSIEKDRQVAIQKLQEIAMALARPDKDLLLIANFDTGGDTTAEVRTNYFRELIYNLEHTVHHMALLRIGIEAVSELILPSSFGVAASTLKFRQECAQ